VPSMAVFLVMYTTLVLIGLIISLKPFIYKSMLILVVFNLAVMLYLAYLSLLFTDFVDQKISDSTGNQFLYTTLIIIALNVLFWIIFAFQKLCIKIRIWYRN
jgi:hypothetical protein